MINKYNSKFQSDLNYKHIEDSFRKKKYRSKEINDKLFSFYGQKTKKSFQMKYFLLEVED